MNTGHVKKYLQAAQDMRRSHFESLVREKDLQITAQVNPDQNLKQLGPLGWEKTT